VYEEHIACILQVSKVKKCVLLSVGPAVPRLMYCSLLRLIVLTPLWFPPFLSRGAPRQMAWETSISERWNYGREMTDQFSLTMATSTSLYGSFTCRRATTWDRRLYFLSEWRHAEEFFAWKIRRPGLNQRTWVPEASMITTRPPRPLKEVCYLIVLVSTYQATWPRNFVWLTVHLQLHLYNKPTRWLYPFALSN
jgi:hypothetical protein